MRPFIDFTDWDKTDRKIFAKITTLLKDIDRASFTGLGKPEPLKHQLSGYWSRRITNEHRLVYQVNDAEISVVSCRYHYE
ncbi:Txe/YoeB family addiction module toxin [filamentous cyanobacterium LEGE 11480]|uniref:Endoribonuclease YoeB n=1 Tax=Romeriopsis navalis LEGE 11480 TaxID=2777977 RepID=A0A928Z3K7_9CYAN|nr:Txe/YoeB family addiction module toxin [Romeriopsis navalis]MBE9030784.1 Txe/YoeB family addiction module toxin [Romeriopsis navalis LEGE 11480]